MKHSQTANGRIGVGSTVVAKRATGVCEIGEAGVCYEVYTLDNRPGYSIIFQSGRYDGFSPGEVATMLRVTGRCDALAGYQFRNVQQLIRDYEAGLFAPAFAQQRPGPER
jgi:hypothetical protein